ncbi:MAG TPA: hypothetical protein ENN73_06355 [Firmicutes bacterium]|nr:hypothetical protein [Bacillota bacterium]
MMRRDIISFVNLLFLSAAFILISFLLHFTCGTHTRLLSAKLRLGALIINLTSAFSSGGDGAPFVSCYRQLPRDHIYIKPKGGARLRQGTEDLILQGRIENGTRNAYSFVLLDNENNEVIHGEIEFSCVDKESSIKEFEIKLPESLMPGDYILGFFLISEAELKYADIRNPHRRFNFSLISNPDKVSD